MHFLKNASIRTKLLFITMTMTLFTLVIIASGFTIYDIRNTKNNLSKELELVNNIIAARSSLSVKFNNQANAQENLSDLSFKRSINLACIYNNQGSIFVEHRTLEEKRCPNIPPETGHFYGNNHVSFHQEIYTKGGEQVGSLYIESDLKEIQQHLLEYAVGIFVALIVIVILAFLLANQLQKILSVPIAHLRRVSQDFIKNNDYSIRAIVDSSDEVGELTKAFNTMLEEIEEQDKQLHEANANLEKRVDERTKDLKKAMEELQEALRSREAFISSLSHEIRTPLHVMINRIKTLCTKRELVSEQKQEEYLESLYHSTDRLYDLVTVILDLSRLRAGQLTMDFQLHDLGKMIEDFAQEELADGHYSGDKDITFSVEPCKDKLDVECDKVRILQVVTNLFSNAVRYGDGQVKVMLKKAKLDVLEMGKKLPAVQFSISDEGIGIPDHELKAIFQPFCQSSITDDGSGGTGIGLNVCKEIIEAHYGEIWAKNNKGKGVTLTFVLPCKQEEYFAEQKKKKDEEEKRKQLLAA